MTVVVFEVYGAGSGLTRSTFDALMAGGILLGAEGVLNQKWDDFSAEQAVADFGLQERGVTVDWDYTQDDTPSSLACRVLFPALSPSEIERRFVDHDASECLSLGGNY